MADIAEAHPNRLSVDPPRFRHSKEVEAATLLGLKEVTPPITEAIDGGVNGIVVANAVPGFVTLDGLRGVKASEWIDGGIVQQGAPLE